MHAFIVALCFLIASSALIGFAWLLFQPTPLSGIVVDKAHYAAHTNTSYIGNGKSWFPIITFVPEQWFVTIDSAGASNTIEVGLSAFDTIKIGSYINLQK